MNIRFVKLLLAVIHGFYLCPHPAHSDLLDQTPGALAAYSLRRLTTSHLGPVIQVRRTSDNQVADIHFTASGDLDIASLLNFVGAADGEVISWYSQIPGHPAMVPPGSMLPPLIVEAGKLIVDEKSLARLKFFRSDALRIEDPGFSTLIDDANVTVHLVIESVKQDDPQVAFQIIEYGWQAHSFTLYAGPDYWLAHPKSGFGDAFRGKVDLGRNIVTLAVAPTRAQMYQNHELVADQEVDASSRKERYFIVGSRGRDYIGEWSGYLSELVIYPYIDSITEIRKRIDNINSYWQAGPRQYNADALLPQKYQYQVDLYNWLKTVKTSDLELPEGSLKWDGHYNDIDSLADAWMFFAPYKAATLSRVTRQESRWLVLDDGQGGGIEGSGEVRLLHGTGQNNRSWGNEPAYWYSVSLPMADGSNGNPYFRQRSLCMRALVLTAVDLLMYDRELDKGGWATWNDMHGKALLSWSEALYSCTDEIVPSVQAAFEAGFKRNLDISIETGVRDANTNMDMFAVQAAAIIAKHSTDRQLQIAALETAKRLLLGYTDGILFKKHDPDSGSFFPAGYIGENDMADAFYNGESFYHLTGALARIEGLRDWEWIKEVMRRMSLWRIYHAFPEPNRVAFNGPSGFSGRTSGLSLAGQQSVLWRDITVADLIPDARPLLNNFVHGGFNLPVNADKMVNDVQRTIAALQPDWGVIDRTEAPPWSGWSPWPKVFPYLPPSGWYSRLRALIDREDPSLIPPINRVDLNFSLSFGGSPTGMEFWAYRNNFQGRDFGWYVEGDARQGTYGGWYGGKLELFWTRTTGTIIINRHGKTGCNAAQAEDSTCWDMIEKWGAHHVWGRDETGKAFSPIHLKGRGLARTAKYSPEANPTVVEVVNYFNDPGGEKSGEEAVTVLEGQFSITNRFAAVKNGLLISHLIESDQSDQLSELWATIPVSLGETDGDSSTIEYLVDSEWKPLTTEPVISAKLRVGKNVNGFQYAFINFLKPERVRLSSAEYKCPYQLATRIRNVHIDLHGNPGTVVNTPSRLDLSYGINTTASIEEWQDQAAPSAPANLRLH